MVKRASFLAVTMLFLAITANKGAAAAPPFPNQGIDARSLGRGGTCIASDGGIASVFGNPATLRPTGSFSLGFNYLDERNAPEGSYVMSIVDTKSILRGAAVYIPEPSFAGFEDDLWGVAFAQSVNQALIVGASFHRGHYIDPITSGEEDLSAADVGFVMSVGPGLSFGYLLRNLYRSDNDLLDRLDAFGLAVDLSRTVQITADLEESPLSGDWDQTRVGIQFDAFDSLTGRLGYQDLSAGATRYTLGMTLRDRSGSLDAGLAYDPDTERVERFTLAVLLGM
ncbi:MAG: hypothetical protein JSV26_10220 [bacterium]|nr:MAG: hypothetical protein JSV26_10220 [bacterium]